MHNAPSFHIYFGNTSNSLLPQQYLTIDANKLIFDFSPCAWVKERMQLEQLFFLRQIHGADGLNVDEKIISTIASFCKEGDFLVTNQKNVGIGIMTADCLPLIFYDMHNNAVGIAHASWRSSVKNIAQKTVEMMQQNFNTDIKNVQVFFGPSAKSCCYQVQDDFIQNLYSYPFFNKTVQKRDQKLFFDLPQFNALLLESMGFKRKALFLDYNTCTICDARFCSYRREGVSAARQMTVVNLK